MQEYCSAQQELADCGLRLLLTLPNKPKVEMRLHGQARLKPQGLFERRHCTIQIAFLGEPCALCVINSFRRRRACRRYAAADARRLAGVRQLRRGARADKHRNALQQISDRFIIDALRVEFHPDHIHC